MRENGISKVQGNLIIDDSDYDREFISSTHLERYRLDAYAAPFGGLSLNRNVVTLNVGLNGITTDPPVGSLEFVNKVSSEATTRSGSSAPEVRTRLWFTVWCDLEVPWSTTLTIHDPVRFTGSAFFRVLQKAGITMTGKWMTVPMGKPASLAGKVLLGRHRSPVLKDLVRRTNVESDNLLAEHIFRRLGASSVGFEVPATARL